MSRIILNTSGEALKDADNNVSNKNLEIILNTVKLLKKYNHKIAIVIGGGNYFRGREHPQMEVVLRDTIGMLGTIMNSLYIKDYLDSNNIKSIISTPFNFNDLIIKLSNQELLQQYNNGNVIVFGGGVGKSGYSTDSGVILADDILDSDLIIKMTNVDGIYDIDPKQNEHATKFDKLKYDEVLEKNIKIKDR